MWRSFFYAIGIGLFVLGLEALVLDHVVIPKNTKVQKLFRKILSDDKPVAVGNLTNPQVAGGFGQNNGFQNNSGFQNQFGRTTQQASARIPNSSFGYDTGSRFGPSRFGSSQFSGPAYGTGYGGSRISSNQSQSTTFGRQQPLGNNNAQLVGFRTNGSNGPAVKTPVPMQKFPIREWMPWSLLASGAIIFLYTHTIERRRFRE